MNFWNWLKQLFTPKSVSAAQVLPIKPPPAVPVDNSGPIKAAPIAAAEYEAKYNICFARPQNLSELKSVCGKILANMARYKEVELATGVPWKIVGCIHEKEASLNFNTYLQNGDRLFNSAGVAVPTTDVPRGVGPFNPQTWVNAAIHALGGQGAHTSAPRSIGYWLGWAEAYNGLGYRKRGLPSPYIWSFTDQYSKGHYIRDGVFDPNAVDANPGVAAMIKTMGGLDG